MPDELRSSKLTESQQVQVCQWLAEMKSPKTVSELVLQEYDITISRECITQAYLKGDKWQALITELHEVWVRDFAKVPIANKTKRLELLQSLADNAVDPNVRVRALAQAHKELEGNTLTHKGTITHDHMLSNAIKKAKEGESQG